MPKYQVKAGDSYAKIAGQQFGDQRQFKALMDANAGKMLKPGDVIEIPDAVAPSPRITQQDMYQAAQQGGAPARPFQAQQPKYYPWPRYNDTLYVPAILNSQFLPQWHSAHKNGAYSVPSGGPPLLSVSPEQAKQIFAAKQKQDEWERFREALMWEWTKRSVAMPLYVLSSLMWGSDYDPNHPPLDIRPFEDYWPK